MQVKAGATIGIVAAVLLGIGGGALMMLSTKAYAPAGSAAPVHPVWVEARWPFPIDQWGKGRAFRCNPADCGTVVDLYVRAKLGSCNCTTGVESDEDLDRMSDLDLLGGQASPLAGGEPILIGWMKGRTRTYRVAASRDESAISIVFNDRCDMIVATVVLSANQPAAVEPGVREFLNSKSMLHWAEIELGI
jgi:hypothetical protein